jgi:hypothetical protein
VRRFDDAMKLLLAPILPRSSLPRPRRAARHANGHAAARRRTCGSRPRASPTASAAAARPRVDGSRSGPRT